MMTVSELIKELQKYPQDLPIVMTIGAPQEKIALTAKLLMSREVNRHLELAGFSGIEDTAQLMGQLLRGNM